MSSEDPFASFETDRTFLMPSPGQRAARPPGEGDPAAAGLAGAPLEPQVPVEALIPAAGLNPIVIAASPLLNAVPQLRASLTHPNPIGLREVLAQGIRAFEAKAKASGVEAQKVIAARYVLCTFLDETAASTPWGTGVWGKQSLLVMFHNETWGGEKVFQLMAKLAENPGANRDLLELLYVVLALGFEGRYRVLDNGRAQLELLRERLLVMLRNQRGEYERELSPHWRGVEAKKNVMSLLPMWVVIAIAGLLALGLYLGLLMSLNAKSDPLYAEIQGLRVKAPLAPPPKPVTAAPKPRLAGFLEPEVNAGLVAVADYGDRSVITIKGDGFFEPGSATVADKVLPLLVRIGEALNSVQGSVLITGHTDSQPIRSARFPSNWHLSQERALAVQRLLASSVKLERMKAEGRADSEPVAGNATPQDRAKNRRVEITLFVAKPGN